MRLLVNPLTGGLNFVANNHNLGVYSQPQSLKMLRITYVREGRTVEHVEAVRELDLVDIPGAWSNECEHVKWSCQCRKKLTLATFAACPPGRYFEERADIDAVNFDAVQTCGWWTHQLVRSVTPFYKIVQRSSENKCTACRARLQSPGGLRATQMPISEPGKVLQTDRVLFALEASTLRRTLFFGLVRTALLASTIQILVQTICLRTMIPVLIVKCPNGLITMTTGASVV